MRRCSSEAQALVQLVHNRIDSVFTIISSSSVVSQVSSALLQYMCDHKDLLALATFGVYPGQMFQIPVVLYGQRNGSVPGTVHQYRGAHFAPLQETQKTGCSCMNLTHTIFSTQRLELRVDGVIYNKNNIFFLYVTLLLCPPGFQLSTVTAGCECSPLLKDRGLPCNISGALIQRVKSVWIISFNPMEMTPYYIHDNCKTTSLWVQINQSDEQCAYSGTSL